MRGTLLRERPSAGAVSKPAGTSGKPKTPPRLQELSGALQTRPPLFFRACPERGPSSQRVQTPEISAAVLMITMFILVLVRFSTDMPPLLLISATVGGWL